MRCFDKCSLVAVRFRAYVVYDSNLPRLHLGSCANRKLLVLHATLSLGEPGKNWSAGKAVHKAMHAFFCVTGVHTTTVAQLPHAQS